MSENGTHWRQVHKRKNPDLLFAEDLGGLGCQPVDLEVIASGITTVSDGKDSKQMPWLGFAGEPKKLALNVSNSKTMQTLCGTGIVEEWRGWVRLIVVQTTYRDRDTKQTLTTDAIRIAPQRPAAREKLREIREQRARDEQQRSAQAPTLGAVAKQLIAKYAVCSDAATLAALKVERSAAWKGFNPLEREQLLAVVKEAGDRVGVQPEAAAAPPADPPPSPDLTDEEKAAIAAEERANG